MLFQVNIIPGEKMKNQYKITEIFIFTFIFTLVLLSSLSFASCPTIPCPFGHTCDNTSNCVPNIFVNLSNIIIVVTFGIIAVVYMLSQVLSNKMLEHWSKTELYEAVGTAFLLFLYLSLSSFLDSTLGPAFVGTNLMQLTASSTTGPATDSWEGTAFNHAKKYLDARIDEVIVIIKGLTTMAMFSGALSTFSFILMKIGYISLTLFAALGSIQFTVSTVIGAVTMSFLQLIMQRELLGLLSHGVFNILLPLGIFFRAFPVTRSAGSSIIALCIGLGIILPLMYIVLEDVAEFYYTQHNGRFDLTDLSRLGFSGSGLAAGESFKATINSLVSGSLQKAVFAVVVEIMIFPAIAWATALYISKSLGEVLGARVDVTTLLRVI